MQQEWTSAGERGSVFLFFIFLNKYFPEISGVKMMMICVYPCASEKTDRFIYLSKFLLLSPPHPSPFLRPASDSCLTASAVSESSGG